MAKHFICPYCNRELPRSERSDDHIIPKWFFAADDKCREELPVIWCCRDCNSMKSKVDKDVGAFLSFLSASYSAERVLPDVIRAIHHDRRLLKNLRMSVNEIFHDELQINLLGMDMTDEVLQPILFFYAYLTKAFHYKLFKTLIPISYELFVLPVETHNAIHDRLIEFLNQNPAPESSFEKANGLYARLEFMCTGIRVFREDFSMWHYYFRRLEVFAFTVGPRCPEEMKTLLRTEFPKADLPLTLGKTVSTLPKWRH